MKFQRRRNVITIAAAILELHDGIQMFYFLLLLYILSSFFSLLHLKGGNSFRMKIIYGKRRRDLF
jgi:hypothetical protein